jgi:(p)ppGpp synthase/HD superfamily hydrolase
MDELTLKRLMGTIANPVNPEPDVVFAVLLREFLKLAPPEKDQSKLKAAFIIAYHTHQYSPLRKSGESYIFHIIRATIRMIWRQLWFGIYDLEAILLEVTHDCLEDAHLSKRDRKTTERKMIKRLGMKHTFGTLAITKYESRHETDDEYFLRMLKTSIWQVLWAKFEDRIDNMVTLMAMDYGKAVAKIEETEQWFPLLGEKLMQLITLEIDAGRLTRVYRTLPENLLENLHRVIALKKKRLGLY